MRRRPPNRPVALPIALLTLGALACSPPEPGPERGAAMFDTCSPCHGEEGLGNPALGAPAIAGLPRWYVQGQLEKFQQGIRGKHPGDLEGMRMRPMAVSLNHEGDIESIAQHVASLPAPTEFERTVEGNAGAGARAYTLCATCHGPQGQGMEALGAPPIVQLDDWYLLAQLEKFRSGARGTDPRDTWGATMRPNALALTDEGMRDVVTYIRTLR